LFQPIWLEKEDGEGGVLILISGGVTRPQMFFYFIAIFCWEKCTFLYLEVQFWTIKTVSSPCPTVTMWIMEGCLFISFHSGSGEGPTTHHPSSIVAFKETMSRLNMVRPRRVVTYLKIYHRLH
jgi:hypothetical protein